MVIAGLLDPQGLIEASGGWALLVVCAIIFAETGLLVGVVLPGDTMLFFTGVLTFSGVIEVPIALVLAAVAFAAVAGDQLGYLIGRRAGPAIFERRDAGLISRATIERTAGFFRRYGAVTVTFARFIPVVRTVAPVAAGAAQMRYRTFLGFNVIGGILWPTALILIGYFLGQIPWVTDLVTKYIDYVLIGVVLVTAVIIVISVIRAQRKKRAERTGGID